MSLPQLRVNFSGGGIFYLESKLEFRISINSRIRIAERIDDEVNVRVRLSFSKRTVVRFITKSRLRCQ